MILGPPSNQVSCTPGVPPPKIYIVGQPDSGNQYGIWYTDDFESFGLAKALGNTGVGICNDGTYVYYADENGSGNVEIRRISVADNSDSLLYDTEDAYNSEPYLDHRGGSLLIFERTVTEMSVNDPGDGSTVRLIVTFGGVASLALAYLDDDHWVAASSGGGLTTRLLSDGSVVSSISGGELKRNICCDESFVYVIEGNRILARYEHDLQNRQVLASWSATGSIAVAINGGFLYYVKGGSDVDIYRSEAPSGDNETVIGHMFRADQLTVVPA